MSYSPMNIRVSFFLITNSSHSPAILEKARSISGGAEVWQEYINLPVSLGTK
jgi:hypothetical protein